MEVLKVGSATLWAGRDETQQDVFGTPSRRKRLRESLASRHFSVVLAALLPKPVYFSTETKLENGKTFREIRSVER